MATLRRESDGTRWLLPHRCTVGRSPMALLRLADPRVSMHHAEINHEHGVWIVRDRDSRNGTRLDGERLPVEATRRLQVGTRLLFGQREALVVEDLAPPIPMAADLDAGVLVAAVGGVLCLPDAQDPTVCVFAAPEGYRAEVDGHTRTVTDGRMIELGPQAWRLSLPARRPTYPLESIQLSFSSSRAEEFVTTTVTTPTQRHDLPPRPHHGLLLALARRRLADGHLAAAEQGWMAWEDGACDEVLALRRELYALGIEEAGALVERRPDQLRLALPAERLALG